MVYERMKDKIATKAPGHKGRQSLYLYKEIFVSLCLRGENNAGVNK
jgi:hypothetical protein